MHCEIIDRYFNVFFVEIQLQKENLKKVLFGRQNLGPHTGMPVSQTAYICHSYKDDYFVNKKKNWIEENMRKRVETNY